jgi:hypothetical protein
VRSFPVSRGETPFSRKAIFPRHVAPSRRSMGEGTTGDPCPQPPCPPPSPARRA